MNRVLLLFLLGAVLPVSAWENNGTISSLAQIPQETTSFVNRGRIILADNLPIEINTLTFTNQGNAPFAGYMSGMSGFWFNYSPAGSQNRRWLSSFFNSELAQVEAIDYSLPDSQLPRSIIGHSLLRIWSTNIVTGGGSAGSSQAGSRASLIVGANGFMDIVGKNVDLSRSGLEVLPVWNQSSGSANSIDQGVFTPDLAVHDLAAVTGSFGPPNSPNLLNTAALWDGQVAQSANAPLLPPVTVSSFILDDPETDHYFQALQNAQGQSSAGFITLTNYVPLSFTTNDFMPTTTNRLTFTNVVIVSDSYFATNAVFTTNLISSTYIEALGTNNILALQTNTFSFTNAFFPTNAFTTTNIVLTTNTVILGNVFSAQEVTSQVLILSNFVKGAFFGQAPPGFVISRGFSGGTPTRGRTIQATVSTLISNAVTGLSDVASVMVQDTLASAPDRGLLVNTFTSSFPPEPGTTRPANYLVSRGGAFTGVIGGTNVVGTLTNIVGSTVNRPPAADFFTTGGIQDTNNDVFYDANNTTFSDAVDAIAAAVGDYSGYSAEFDNIVEREANSPFASETNRTGRVSIDAERLNLAKTRIRGEGHLMISTPHLISSSNTVIDCENLSFDLASTNNTLRFQNLSKDQVQRLRGNITVWSAIWSNNISIVFAENYALTNGSLIITNFVGTNEVVRTNLVIQRVPFTNTVSVIYHTMMLDARGLTLTVPVTVYDLALRSPNVIFDDNATVARSFFTSARSFTLNGNLSLFNSTLLGTGAGHWFGTNAPNLAFLTNNGLIFASGEARFGGDRTSPYGAFVNNGSVSADSIQLKSTYFENAGTLFASGGPLEAHFRTGQLVGGLSSSSGDTVFSGDDLLAFGSFVGSDAAIVFRVTNSVSDSGFPSEFQAGHGFHLLTKPAIGDFLFSAFYSVAPDVPAAQPLHTWAGEDRGASPAGFTNNAAIGYLLLESDLVSGGPIDPVYVFNPAGAQNALYVDYLDLSALEDYASQLVINPGLTIYFAAADLGFLPPDVEGVPQTPEEFLDGQFGGRLRWVPNFAGPSSSTTVTIDGQDVVVNAALAQSWANRGIDPATALDLGALSVQVFGNGTVTPFTDGQLLIIGQTNTIVAQAGPGATFLGWSGSIESSSPQLTFVMEDGLVLIANFTFSPLAATYNGLFFADTNQLEIDQAGSITFTTAKSGRYSGAVQIAAGRFPFTGQLDEGGADARSIPGTSLFMEIQASTDQITGIIGDGLWSGPIVADRATFHSKTNPAAIAGKYTIVFPGSESVTNELVPFGDGYGTLIVDTAGRVKLAGSLADGTKIAQSATVSANGFWPLFIPLYKGQGHLLSWQTIADVGDKDVGGDYNWIKLPSFARFYPDGFNFTTNAYGSRFNAAMMPLTGFSEVLVELTGGNLPGSIGRDVLLSSQNKITVLGTNKVSLTFNKSVGSFKGSVPHPVSGKAVKFTGVVLQKQGFGSGYFLGTNQSGRVLIRPTP